MMQFLSELLISAAVEGSWHAIVRAAEGNGSPSERAPYNWKNRSDDPVYKKNLQRLIEQNRRIEETRE